MSEVEKLEAVERKLQLAMKHLHNLHNYTQRLYNIRCALRELSDAKEIINSPPPLPEPKK